MFNGPQIHLFLNHFPIIGFMLLTPLVLLVTARCGSEYQRLALIGTFVISLLALPAFFTGEPAEEGVEDLLGIQEKLIHEHEEAAEVALSMALITGVLAGVSWFLTRKSDGLLNVVMPLVSVACLATAGVMGWTGHAGGMIRHPEISADVSADGEKAPFDGRIGPGAGGQTEPGESEGKEGKEIGDDEEY
jgi:hypothetical protein